MPYSHNSQGLQVEKMDALRSSMRPEAVAAPAASFPADDMAWVVEKGSGLLGTDFSVEELLDFGEFAEPEKEAADADEEGKVQLDATTAAINSDGNSKAEAKKEEEEEQDGKSNSNSNASSGVTFDLLTLPPPEIDLPAHDAAEFEWVSRIMDDTLSELPPTPPAPAPYRPAPTSSHRPNYPPGAPYRSAPPQPHADPIKIATICALSTEALVPIKSKRSKRSRAAAWGPPRPLSDSSSSSTTSSCSSSSSFSPYFYYDAAGFVFDENNQQLFMPPQPKKSKSHKKSKKPSNPNQKPKKRGRRPKLPGAGSAMANVTDRKCSHCGVQKTPQWRAGPEGAKTLCNACGVRYKSGRLLPEYRPACSPTFMTSVHSNSHRKVLEMRRKKEVTLLSTSAPPLTSF